VSLDVKSLFQRARGTAPVARLEDFGFAELRGGGSRVSIVPALGGKIAHLELGGRQWLWASDVLPYATPDETASYVETADTGGYDECFPTVGACKVPTWIRGFGGVQLPDHGELWSQAPTIDVRTAPEGQSATTTWMGRRMPYRFSRVVRVTPSGDVEFEYEVTNTGTDRVPFVWSAHPVLPLTSSTRIDLPAATRMHVYAQHEIALGVGATDLRWPMIRSAGRLLDMSNPFAVAKRYACKLFLEMREGRAAIVEDGVRLEVSFSVDEVPNFGLWINRSGWTPLKRGKPYSNIAFEPCIGAPDTLEEALGAWKSAHWLDAGKSRRWSLRWSAVAVQGESEDARS
jgi:galactose mutarotase-like enzyme